MKKITIGRTEWCSMPDLNLPFVKARVDTGARTSALHAQKIKPFERAGEKWVSFEVHPIQKTRKVTISCEAPIKDYRSVKSSSGVSQQRYVIETKLLLGDREQLIEITLTNRRAMGHRMLLGRQALSGLAVVDSAKIFTQGRHKKLDVKKSYPEIKHL